MPLIAVILLGLCPVFFDFRGLLYLQQLLPPTHYINASFDGRYFLYMLGYIPACLGAAFALAQVRRLLRLK